MMWDVIGLFSFEFLILASWVLFAVMQLVWKNSDKKFTEFLNANREEIMSGGSCEYNGFTYTRETRVTRFSCCISVIILTLCRSSCIVPADSSVSARVLCILMTIIGGWWGIPWGPIRTVQSVYRTATAETFTLYDIYTRGM